MSGWDLDHVSRLVPAAPCSRIVLVVPGSQPRTQLLLTPGQPSGSIPTPIYPHSRPIPAVPGFRSAPAPGQYSEAQTPALPHKPRLPVYLKIWLAPIATGSRQVPMEPGFRPIPAPDLFLWPQALVEPESRPAPVDINDKARPPWTSGREGGRKRGRAALQLGVAVTN